MAIAIGTSASTSGTSLAGGAPGVTFACTTSGSNRAIFVGTGTGQTSGTVTITTCTYNGVALGKVWGISNTNWLVCEGWCLPTNSINTEPATGANNVNVQTSDTATMYAFGATPLNGVHQTVPLGTPNSAESHAGTTEPNISISSATGEIVIAVCDSDSDSTITEGSTATPHPLWEHQAVGSDICVNAQYYAGAASVNAQWATSDNDGLWAVGGVSIKPAATGQTVAIGQITETDLSQAVDKLKTIAQGQSAETDLSQALTRLKTAAVSQATETDVSQSFSGTVTIAIGQSTESDVVFTLDRMKSLDPGQATETDVSQANAIIKLKSIGSVTETDVAQEFLVAKFVTVTAVVETDESLQVLLAGAPLVIPIGQITEVDVAQTLDRQKTLATVQTTETDESQAAAVVKFSTIGQIEEIDAPQVFLSLKTLSMTGSEETDAAQAQGVLKIRSMSRAAEIDVAQLMTVVGGALGSTVLIYDGAGGPGVTEHQGISQPTLILEHVAGDQYNVTKTHQISDDALNSASYTVDGELP